jgi:DNA excision repair protein ERCC-8
MEDSTGIAGFDGMGRGARGRDRGKSHNGTVNGLAWTDNGSYIVSAGHDERVRVWDAALGANTLASFGPTLKNSHLSNLPLITTPTSLTQARKELLIYPNEREILMFELHEGKLLKRLKVPGPAVAAVRSRTGERSTRNRITALAWRSAVHGFYSAHTDGQIRAWVPRTKDDAIADKEEEESLKGRAADDDAIGKRKREVLDDVFKSLTRQKISFG